jgi:hypothetical protein
MTISSQSVSGTGTISAGSLTIAAGSASGSGAGTGGSLLLRSGDKSNAAFAGTVQLRSGSAAAGTMVEVNGAFAGGLVVALCVQNVLTTTMMPANTGAGVVYFANAGSIPTANPVGGGILYTEAGALKWRGTGGTVTTIAAA